MFAQLLRDGGRFADRPAFVSTQSMVTWSELSEAVAAENGFSELRGQRVAVTFQPGLSSLVVLARLDELACDVFLLDSRTEPPAARQLGGYLRVSAIVRPARDFGTPQNLRRLNDPLPGSGTSTVTLLTSGTEGRPKAARHSWNSLARPVRHGDPGECQSWLLTYRAHLYAGLQVLLQCLVNYGTLAVPDPDDKPDDVLRLMSRADVRHVSATPSYWRQLLLFGSRSILKRLRVQSITLGGEVVDQQILDALNSAFPAARITHIYATTEMGRCFSVTDGQAGFPVELLHQPRADGVQLKVEQGELLVRSSNRMQGYVTPSASDPADRPNDGQEAISDEWFRTGDLVEIHGDRVFFAGRRSEMINVGGNKIHPIEVERVIRSVPGIADVRVYAAKSSLAGQLVACQIVPQEGHAPEGLRSLVAERCAQQLSSFQRPRLIELTDRIVLTEAGKICRKNPASR